MATASVGSCLQRTPPRPCRKPEMQLFFSFLNAFIFLSLHSVPQGLLRALRKAVTWQPEQDGERAELSLCGDQSVPSLGKHLELFPTDVGPVGAGWAGMWGSGLQRHGQCKKRRKKKKSADSAGITAILRFQNFLPPLPKYKGTFVLNSELEHWWAPRRAPCGIWFLATVHVFIMMGEGKEGSCSYQHANNLLQRTGELRAN